MQQEKKMTLKDQDAIIALQLKGMSLEDAIFNTGYEKGKQQHPVSSGWVKVSEFKFEVGISYCAKDENSRGAGFFHKNGAFIWGDGSITHPRDQDDLLILDEAGQSNKDAVEFAEWLDEQRNNETPEMWAEKVIWDKPNAFQEWLKYFNQQNRNNVND